MFIKGGGGQIRGSLHYGGMVVVVMINVMVAVALLLFLVFGPLGLFFALGTWPLSALAGLVAGLIFAPDRKPK